MPSATISFTWPPASPWARRGAHLRGGPQRPARGHRHHFLGTAQAFQESFKGLWLLLILAITVIYIVLGILYECFIHPLTILSGLPSAGAGALLTLLVFGLQLDIYGFVGIIMLVGIVRRTPS
jgi:HAE1 family hydrophobic/amphiphilic exporter-1